MRKLLRLVTSCSLGLTAAALAPAAHAQVRLSQIYGSGGNSQSMVRNDFIEIYNAGAPQDLTGWSVQYASATGTTWSVTALPAVVLGTGRYLLVQEGTGGTLVAGQVPDLPAPDATGAIAMSATDFKVALVSSTTALTGATPTFAGAPALVDLVGAGGTTTWNETAAAGGAFLAANNAPPCATAYAIYRRGCGASDTDSNKDDWATGWPAPRNTATAANNAISAIGTALPLTVKAGQNVRLTATPYRCATSDLGAGTTLSVNTTAIGGGPTAMLDNGTGGDEVAGDGLFTALVTVGAGTASGTKTLPLTLSDAGGNSGGSAISIYVTPATAPDNDNCSSALAVAVPSVTAGTLVGATVETNPIVTGVTGGAFTSGMTSRKGVWYSLTGTGNTITASLCATTPSFDSLMMVLAGTCDGLTVIGLDDDFCGNLSTSEVTWCSQAGTNYFVWVAPFSTALPTSAFTLTVTDSGAPCTTAAPIALCSGVAGPFTEVEPGYGPHTNDGCTTTPNRFTDIPAPGPAGVTLRGTARGMIGNRDVDWYRFQATVSGPISITTNTLGSQAQAQLQSLGAGGSCPATLMVFTPIQATRCASGTQTIAGTVTAGNWYAILVVGGIGLQATPAGTIFGGQMPGGRTYQYALNVSIGAPPANDNCAAALPLTGISVSGDTATATNDGSSSCDPTGRDVWYSFTAGSDPGTLSLDTCAAGFDSAIAVFSACGGAELACNDDCGGAPCAGPGSCLSVPVGANQSVRIRVSDKGTAGGAFTLNWAFAVPPAVNDDCSGAIPISGSGAFPFDNRFAAPAAAITPLGCASSGSKDLWYLWYPTGSGTATVDTCTGSPAWDSVILVYTGSCAALTQVACNDDSCGLMSSVSFSVTCGTPYYIQVASWGTSAGVVGTLNVSAPLDPTGTSFCAGDGSGTPCPCGNNSAAGAGEGCLNSLGTGGKLVANGCASISADSVRLLGSQMPNSSALYFQGTSQQSGGLGAAFGDGLRCAGGSIIRLKTVANVGGASQYPQAGDQPVSVRGLVAAPGTRTYQVWYRNAAAFCTVSTFNLTNGRELTWGP